MAGHFASCQVKLTGEIWNLCGYWHRAGFVLKTQAIKSNGGYDQYLIDKKL